MLLVFLYDFVCLFSACCFCHFRVVLLLCCVPPVLHPPPPPPHSDPKTWHSRCSRQWCCLLSFLPSFLPRPPSLPFVHPLTSISLSSVCVCPFCDVIPEDTDSPSWTNSGLSLLLLHLLSLLTGPSLLLPFYSFSTSNQLVLHLPPPPHPSRLRFSVFTRLNSLATPCELVI